MSKTYDDFEHLAEYRSLVIDPADPSHGLASRDDLADRAAKALELIVKFGGIDGNHHKAWLLDQIARVLADDRYEEMVRDARDGEDGPETYGWDEGIPP